MTDKKATGGGWLSHSGIVVGEVLRARREQRGWRQEDVARMMRAALHPWERVTVAAVEAGTRSLSLTELAALSGVFGRPLAAWLRVDDLEDPPEGLSDPADILVETSPESWVSWSALLEALQDGAELQWGGTGGPPATAQRIDETDRKAGRALGVAPEVVRATALRAWGMPLSEQRDAVVGPAVEYENPRSMQARRGHVTRDLMNELRSMIEDRDHTETLEE